MLSALGSLTERPYVDVQRIALTQDVESLPLAVLCLRLAEKALAVVILAANQLIFEDDSQQLGLVGLVGVRSLRRGRTHAGRSRTGGSARSASV